MTQPQLIRLKAAAVFSIQVFTTTSTTTNANAARLQSKHRQSCSVRFTHV